MRQPVEGSTENHSVSNFLVEFRQIKVRISSPILALPNCIPPARLIRLFVYLLYLNSSVKQASKKKPKKL